jgi:aspartyl protease
MGMGFQSISDYNAPPPVQNLISEGAVTKSMFGFKFASSGSELYIGGVNPGYSDDDFTWLTLSNEV